MAPSDRSKSLDTRTETLARVVLRCRDLAQFLEQSQATLPERGEAAFLFGQLEDALQRLQTQVRAYQTSESTQEKGGFLRRLAGRKPRESRKEPHYDLEGNAWTIPVTELVGFLSHSAKSGILWVTSPSETFVLEFMRGNLVHATSNCPPAAYRLGEILVRERLLTSSELALEVQHARAADDFLGSYMVNSGRLRHADLQRALAIQVQQLFHRLMDADNAFYRFQEGAQLQKSESLEVNITQLLLESARQKDEERQLSETRTMQRADVLAALEEASRRPTPQAEPSAATSAESGESSATRPPAETAPEPPSADAASPEAASGTSSSRPAVEATVEASTHATSPREERPAASSEPSGDGGAASAKDEGPAPSDPLPVLPTGTRVSERSEGGPKAETETVASGGEARSSKAREDS